MENFDIKPDEGLCEYIRRVEAEQKKLSEISGVPKELMGDVQKYRPSETIRITGSAEFIEKFTKNLPK